MMFYLNEYLTNRVYGGPEEGGWWYDVGEFVETHGRYSSAEEAETARAGMADWLATQREGQRHPSSVICDGWTVLGIEQRPGQSYPQHIPRYE